MAIEKCIALAELRAVLETGEPGLPGQWSAAFGSLQEAADWAAQNHPDPLVRGMCMAVSVMAAASRLGHERR